MAFVLFALVGLGIGLRLWLAVTDDGIYWPDEIHQSLEPAHRWLFGYGLIANEFYLGARNWAFPGFTALVLRACSWVSDAPRRYIEGVRVSFALVAALAIWGCHRLARALGANAAGSALAAILFALAPPAIYFAPRALSDTASATLVVWGFALALEAVGSRPRSKNTSLLVLGVSLVGLAVLFRLQNGLFAVGLVVLLVPRRKDALVAFGVLCVWAVAYGALDRITWGSWYHSVLPYVRLQDQARLYGVAPFTYYAQVVWRAMPLIVLVALPLAVFANAPVLMFIVVADLVAMSLVAHKELRFIFALLPLWFVLAGVGYTRIAAKPWLFVAGAMLALVSGLRFHQLTFPELGLYEDKPPVTAFDGFGDVNRLLLAAHDRADLCGLKLDAARLAWSGGATYLHRDVPIYARDDAASAGHYNYVIAVGGVAGGEIVARDGRTVLARVAASCTPDSSYNWALH